MDYIPSNYLDNTRVNEAIEKYLAQRKQTRWHKRGSNSCSSVPESCAVPLDHTRSHYCAQLLEEIAFILIREFFQPNIFGKMWYFRKGELQIDAIHSNLEKKLRAPSLSHQIMPSLVPSVLADHKKLKLAMWVIRQGSWIRGCHFVGEGGSQNQTDKQFLYNFKSVKVIEFCVLK